MPSRKRQSDSRKFLTENGLAQKRSFAERARAAVSESDGNQPRLGKRALRTRDQILNSAVALFLERGYGGITIDEIADAAGISRASFYTYFPSKREILLLAGVRSNQARTTAISTIVEIPDAWNLEHLKKWIRRYFAFLDEYSSFQLVWSQAAWFDDELRSLGVKGTMHSAGIVGDHMRRLGASHDADARIDGLAVMSMLDRFWYFWRKTKAPFNEAQVFERLAGMLMALLNSRAGPERPEPRRDRPQRLRSQLKRPVVNGRRR